MSDIYRIATVADIRDLTPDQRERCVVDLLHWCRMHDLIANDSIASSLVEFADANVMQWVDDGKHDAAVVLVDKATGEPLSTIDVTSATKRP